MNVSRKVSECMGVEMCVGGWGGGGGWGKERNYPNIDQIALSITVKIICAFF